jgi:RNA polymerase sigma-70 factor, ECF subfamily
MTKPAAATGNPPFEADGDEPPDKADPGPQRTSDDDVYQRLEHRDIAGAVHLVILRYGPSVYNFCRLALRDTVLAEDVHQQVFLDVFRDIPMFQARSTIRTWLFGIARHRILDAAKKRRRARARISPTELSDQLADEPDPGPSPAESVDATRLQEALEASLGDLSERARISVLLRYLQGLTFEEIAQVCGETPGTHHARVTRALRRLREGIESRIGGERLHCTTLTKISLVRNHIISQDAFLRIRSMN